jgi:hypothetical protein
VIGLKKGFEKMAVQGESWKEFGARAGMAGAPLYAQLATAIQDDSEIQSLADGRKKGQPAANLLLAAVHFLLLKGAAHPLREFYATVNGGRSIGGEPYPVFRDFCLKHRDAIVALVNNRITNTNEVGRCSALLSGFVALSAVAPEPFNLIEIGPSAGLNLNWYRYAVRYLRDGKPAAQIGDASALTIDAELRGSRMPPDGPLPQIKKVIGLERDPVDLSLEDERTWLKALVWPDQLPRFQRLEQAIAVASKYPPPIWKGDALDLMVPALRSMPENETLCVYHSVALYQFSDDARETLDAMLVMAGLRRPVYRLSMEVLLPGGVAELRLFRYHDGTVEDRLLAHCNSHGSWLEWKA